MIGVRGTANTHMSITVNHLFVRQNMVGQYQFFDESLRSRSGRTLRQDLCRDSQENSTAAKPDFHMYIDLPDLVRSLAVALQMQQTLGIAAVDPVFFFAGEIQALNTPDRFSDVQPRLRLEG